MEVLHQDSSLQHSILVDGEDSAKPVLEDIADFDLYEKVKEDKALLVQDVLMFQVVHRVWGAFERFVFLILFVDNNCVCFILSLIPINKFCLKFRMCFILLCAILPYFYP